MKQEANVLLLYFSWDQQLLMSKLRNPKNQDRKSRVLLNEVSENERLSR